MDLTAPTVLFVLWAFSSSLSLFFFLMNPLASPFILLKYVFLGCCFTFVFWVFFAPCGLVLFVVCVRGLLLWCTG